MKYFLLLICSIQTLFANNSLEVLYSSIDPKSLAENLALYELYPESPEGKKALHRAWSLLNKDAKLLDERSIDLSKAHISPIISLINHQKPEALNYDLDSLELIRKLAEPLKNRSLKGYQVTSINSVFELPIEEIDLSRALLLAQLPEDTSSNKSLSFYEASIDLMALQIAARLSNKSTDQEKIRAINNFLFHEMQFRFPPQSLWAKDIDTYTFLSSVIDKRQGVCLGVSILYLCLAQRLGLTLEAVTPPGHIYVRYPQEDDSINIETTARGIDIPTEHYLSLGLEKLQTRNLLEIIGLAFINQASVSWSKKDYKSAKSLYIKALSYLPDDILLKELLGYTYLFSNEKAMGEKLLRQVQNSPRNTHNEGVIEDYFAKNTNIEGIQAIFMPVDDKRESIIAKRKELEGILKKYPRFRAGLLQLSNTWLQLGREKEALKVLKQYYQVDPSNPKVNYYLSAISLMRSNYIEAWKYLKDAKKLLNESQHSLKVLTKLQRELEKHCPDPLCVDSR